MQSSTSAHAAPQTNVITLLTRRLGLALLGIAFALWLVEFANAQLGHPAISFLRPLMVIVLVVGLIDYFSYHLFRLFGFVK